jgi:FkbM family methyltransferase
MIAITKLASALFSGGIKGHFGQWAEDVLIRKLFDKSKRNGVYLDIGSYHPFTHSNTAYFWMKGWHGFNVDANPHTIKLFNKYRPTDTNIWTAIIPAVDYENGTRRVSLMLPSKADYSSGVAATGTVNNSVGNERGFSETQEVPATSVASLLENKNIKNIDYLNIDIEGYDEIILSEIDFSIITPTVVTVEDYSDNLEQLVNSRITNLMKGNGYALAGRAGPTSVFLKRS